MSEPTTIQALGLYTSPNELSAPPGALRKAQNCVMLAPGIIGSRRGMPALSYAPATRATAMSQYSPTLGTLEKIIVNTVDGSLFYDSGAAFVSFGASAYSPPDAYRQKYAECSRNLYLNILSGTVRVDSFTRTPMLAGAPRTQQILSAATNATASGYLPTANSVAYRLVFGRQGDSWSTTQAAQPTTSISRSSRSSFC